MGDLEILSNVQRELECNVLVSGYTHNLGINLKENILYLNLGSISGALSPLNEDCIPSFILLVLQWEDVTIYSYVLKDNNKKFEVGKIEYYRRSNELKIVKEIGADDIKNEKNEKEKEKENNNEKEEKNISEKNDDENNNKINDQENIVQQEIIKDNNRSSLIQNKNEENKEADNKDEKMDE